MGKFDLKKHLEEYRKQGQGHKINEIPQPQRQKVQEKIDAHEIPHNPWPEAQFKAIMANTKDPEKREKYAREQKEGKE